MNETLYEKSAYTVIVSENMYIEGVVRVQGAQYAHPFSCDRGDVVRLYALFTDDLEVPYDPPNLTLAAKDPNDIVVDHTVGIVNDALGRFHCDVTVLVSGTWFYRWASDKGVSERSFHVRESQFVS